MTIVCGSYLHTENGEEVTIVLENDIFGIMERIEPAYTRFIHTNRNSKRKLYVCLTKALCGLVRLALLWYNLCSLTLVNDKYFLNKYDACTAHQYECISYWCIALVLYKISITVGMNTLPLVMVQAREHTYL